MLRRSYLGWVGCWMLGALYCLEHPELLPAEPKRV